MLFSRCLTRARGVLLLCLLAALGGAAPAPQTLQSPYDYYLKTGKRDPKWDALLDQAITEYDARRYANALRLFQQAVDKGCQDGFITLYLAECTLFQFKTNVPGIHEWYEQSARYFKQSYDDILKRDPKNYWLWGTAVSYAILSEIVLDQPGNAEAVMKPFTKDYNYWMITGVRYITFADHYLHTGDWVRRSLERAIDCFQKANEVDPKAPEPHIEMGMLYYRLRKTLQGKEHFQKAVDLGNIFVTWLAQARAHKERSEYAAALHYQLQLCKKLEEMKSPELYYATFHQAVTWFLLDHYDQAGQTLKRALEQAPPSIPVQRQIEIFQWQAELHRVRKQYDKELESNLKAWTLIKENKLLGTVETRKIDVTLQNIIYGLTRLKQFDRAGTFLNEYQEIFPLKDKGTYPDFARAHMKLAQGDVPAAFDGFRQSHETLLRQIKLNQHLAAGGVTAMNSYQQYDRVLTITQRMIELAVEYDQKDTAWDWLQFYKRLRFSLRLLEANQTRQVRELTQEEVRASLAPDEVLLEYLVTSKRTYAWVMTRDKTDFVPLNPDEEILTKRIKTFRTQLQDPSSDDWKKEARALYQDLVKPLKPHLSRKKLIIAPSKALFFTPFQALLDDDGKHLMDSHDLSFVPGAGVLVFCRDRAWEPGARYLGLGNPVVDDASRQELSFTRGPETKTALPFSEKEIQKTQALFTNPLAAVGKGAKESFFKTWAPSSQYLHLACHAKINLFDPTYSALFLAGDAAEDGRLEAHEIAGMDLSRTNLAVLSACQSGLGNLDRGDHITGLADAFMAAGVPVVAATLWNVEDESTSLVGSEFFARILKNPDPVQALREAQRVAAARKPHPYYWAGWTILGAGGPLKKKDPDLGQMDEIDHAGEKFQMDRYEVTNQEYARFIETGGYQKKDWWTDAGWEWRTKNNIIQPAFWKHPAYNKPLQPVVGVSWYEAAAYAKWAGKSLPTVKQWMTAFIADGKKLEVNNNQANLGDTGYRDGYRFTAPVGRFETDKGPWGTYDLIGNVSEWCEGVTQKESTTVAPVSGDHFDELNKRFDSAHRPEPVEGQNNITVYVGVTSRPAWIGFRCVKPVK